MKISKAHLFGVALVVPFVVYVVTAIAYFVAVLVGRVSLPTDGLLALVCLAMFTLVVVCLSASVGLMIYIQE